MKRFLPLLLALGCAPAHEVPVRTALEAAQCVNRIVLSHVDARADFNDPVFLAQLAGEIATECTPRKADGVE